MNTKIKVCGLKRLEDIKIINKYPVDYVGFVFADSKRRVTKEQVIHMKKILNKEIKTVGVFVNTPSEQINEIVEYTGIDIVQLHGIEQPEEMKKIVVPVWKGILMKDEDSINKVSLYRNANGILLDGAKAGSGESFKWQWAETISNHFFTILAGGLTPENVQASIDLVHPHVVDVSTGVEINGVKNEMKIKEFILRVKNNE